MAELVLVLANLALFAVICGAIVFCVRFDQQGKTRRRELEHAERMLALERGLPLDDPAIVRYRALGAIGVAVPTVSVSGAIVGSCFALAIHDPAWEFAGMTVVWLVCGSVCWAALPAITARLGRPEGHSERREGPA